MLFDQAAAVRGMAKRTAESESELQPIANRVRFGDAGTPHRFTPAVGKRRL